MCYTYDNLSRLLNCTTKNADGSVKKNEDFAFDSAGNITQNQLRNFTYDINNRLETMYTPDVTASYDRDGNLLSNGWFNFTYDSSNRLITGGGHNYEYDAENTRIYSDYNGWMYTEYTYNTNCRLSQLLVKITDGVITKYVYGLGLIGQESECTFKTYHYDYRGSTVAITDDYGQITDTLEYDSYGDCVRHTGNTEVVFGYNGRDGVMTEQTDLLYMRSRYFSKQLMRFVNADILHGDITDSQSLNRYAYVNGNPVSYVDPLGLEKQRGEMLTNYLRHIMEILSTSRGLQSGVNIGTIRYYSNYVLTNGNGIIDSEIIMNEQLDLLSSIAISGENISFSYSSDNSFGMEYKVNINENNILSASFSKGSYSETAEFTITTKINETSSISTTLGLEKYSTPNQPKATPKVEEKSEANSIPSVPNFNPFGLQNMLPFGNFGYEPISSYGGGIAQQSQNYAYLAIGEMLVALLLGALVVI